MNVLNKYSGWTCELIKQDMAKNSLPYTCLMSHVDGDFNLSTAIRNANAFGCKDIYYYGRRSWDRRGTVGTHHYTNLIFLDSMDSIKQLKSKYRFVAIECNIDRDCVSIHNYKIQPNTLFLFGEETKGLSNEVLDICDDFVYIPMLGSVRSLNVGTASGIVMAEAMRALTQAGGKDV